MPAAQPVLLTPGIAGRYHSEEASLLLFRPSSYCFRVLRLSFSRRLCFIYIYEREQWFDKHIYIYVCVCVQIVYRAYRSIPENVEPALCLTVQRHIYGFKYNDMKRHIYRKSLYGICVCSACAAAKHIIQRGSSAQRSISYLIR